MLHITPVSCDCAQLLSRKCHKTLIKVEMINEKGFKPNMPTLKEFLKTFLLLVRDRGDFARVFLLKVVLFHG